MSRIDPDRLDLGRRRIINILKQQTAANMRTLEQKISDAGPNDLRVDPHVLTKSRQQLEKEGDVLQLSHGVPWFHLASADHDAVIARLDVLAPIHHQTADPLFTRRAGQALEIAIYRSLVNQSELQHLGHFSDLDEHDDSTPYSKRDPTNSLSGNTIPGNKALDFLAQEPTAGLWGGIEAKNVRQWIYPDSEEIKDLLYKACYLDVVPVLIARRIAYVTFGELQRAGLVIHQTYRQRYPTADAQLLALASDKNLLGYHDLMLGNDPDARLDKFLHVNLPGQIVKARPLFEQHKSDLLAFGSGRITYEQLKARLP